VPFARVCLHTERCFVETAIVANKEKLEQEVLGALKQRKAQIERDRDSVYARDPDEGFSYYQPPDPLKEIDSFIFSIERIFKDVK